jgi:hypothetical protein
MHIFIGIGKYYLCISVKQISVMDFYQIDMVFVTVTTDPSYLHFHDDLYMIIRS